MKTVLVIDDERNIREVLRLLLGDEYRVICAENGREGMKMISAGPDIVILDLLLPDIHGLELLKRMKSAGLSAPVIILSGLNEARAAVEAISLGAADYLVKPFDRDNLRLMLRRNLEMKRLAEEVASLKHLTREYRSPVFVGESAGAREIRERARIFADSAAIVLVTGESGSDKELVARLIHFGGKRAGEPFLPFHCSSAGAGEFRGHFAGAESGVPGAGSNLLHSGRGTIFLDEAGELPEPDQALLERLCREAGPPGRGTGIIASAGADLEEKAARGAFRPELYYLLNGLRIDIPPLRERPEDIPLLASGLVTDLGKRFSAQTREITPEALEILAAYRWPGNERELANMIERLLVLFGERERVGAREVRRCLDYRAAESLSSRGVSLEEKLRETEAGLIAEALARTGGVKSEAARLLKTTRRIFSYRMKKLGIRAEDFSGPAGRGPQ